jgi:phosphoribosyl-ATP pyrophosphohydrolase
MVDAINRLYEAVSAARDRDPAFSRTAKLFRDGVEKMAKKVAEEAVELGIEAIKGRHDLLVQESADLIYQICVLWAEAGVVPDDVWNEMERREKLYGLAEKLPKTAGRHEGQTPITGVDALIRARRP